MCALAADTPRNIQQGEFNELPVLQSTKVYEGAFVGLSSGYARGLVAGDVFKGIAYKQADNSSGSSGDKRVKVYKDVVIEIAVTGASAVTDAGSVVYASADDTLTLTASTNSPAGYIERWITGTTCAVRLYDHSSEQFVNVTMANLTTTGNITLGNAVSDTIGMYGTTPTAQQTHVTDAAAATALTLTDSTGGTADNTIANITAAGTITDNSGGADPGNNTIAAITEANTITDSSTGSDPGTHTIAAITEAATITDSSTGADPGNNTIAAITEAGTITDNSGGADPGNNIIAAITEANTITDSSGGVDPANNIIAAVTNLDTLTDSTGGSADNTVAAVGAIRDIVVMVLQAGKNGTGALALTGTAVGDAVLSVINVTDGGASADVSSSYETTITVENQIQQSAATDFSTSTLIFTVARPRQSDINNNFKELTDQVVTQKAANTAILAAVAQLAAKTNTNSTAINSASNAVAQLAAKMNTNSTAIDSAADAVAQLAAKTNTNSTAIDSAADAVAQLAAKINLNSTAINSASNAVAQLAAKQNTTSTAVTTIEANLCDLTDEINKLITDVGLIRTVVNATLVRLETIGIVASA